MRVKFPMSGAVVVLGLALAAPALPGTDEPALEGEAARLSAQAVAAHVAALASDEFEGRFPGSAGEEKTVAYLSREFEALGLKPLGRTGYRQPVELVTLTPRTPPVVRLTGDFGVLEPQPLADIVVGPGRPLPETDLSASPVVFAGYGIVAPEEQWDDYAGVDVRGATVLVLWGEPSADAKEPRRFKGDALTHHATSLEKQKTAALRGAAALVQIHEEGRAGFPWSALAGQAGRARLQLRDRDPRETPLVQGAMRGDYVRAFLERAGRKLDDLATLAGQRGFRALTLPKVTASITLRSEMKESTSSNVLAMLPGRLRPQEHVFLTAHWDHVGAATSGEGDRIFNGAVDNATGTAALLELARVLSVQKPAPERTIVFFATTCEEQGLLGSRYYVRHPLLPLRDTVAVLNMDAWFPFGATKGMASVGMGQSPDLDALLARANAVEGRRVLPDSSPQFGAYFRSDHYPFAAAGVPALFAVNNPATEEDPSETADVQRWQDYVATRYHKVEDEYDAATWDLGGLMQDVRSFYRVTRWLADSNEWPDWAPDSEFRAVHLERRGIARASP